MAKKTNGQSSSSETPLEFETALEQLEQIVRDLEQGNAPLERGLQLFEEGVTLLGACRKTLEAAELRVREFAEIDETGAVRLKDFEHRRTTSLGGRE
jgi:exodeoxyribonuclease VII small subunit